MNDEADFNVVIAYDTPKAAQWAMRLVDDLAEAILVEPLLLTHAA